MKTLHSSQSRGFVDHGWLQSYHTFSFSTYRNPQRMNFGTLRVLNDDVIAPATGFGTHPHDNMEIVSIPISGALRHQDSVGNKAVISCGEVQIMSAGTGVTHSEHNNSDVEKANFLQIWILPKEPNISPRYGQKRFDLSRRQNCWQYVVAPDEREGSLWINQDAYFSLGHFAATQHSHYTLNHSQHGLYVFVISGELSLAGETLHARDALGLSQVTDLDFSFKQDSDVLLIEVPMEA